VKRGRHVAARALVTALAAARVAGVASIAIAIAIAALPSARAQPAPANAGPAPTLTLDVTGRYSAEEQALYRRRLDERTRSQRDFDSYDTTEPVPGARTWHPLPAAADGQRTIAASALEAARDYAGANASTSLLVWRAGRVEAEHYYGERNRADTVLGRSLAKPLAAIAVGRAIALGRIGSLDQPVADFFPSWRSDARKARMRVRHLLDMTSGFPPQTFATAPDDLLNLAFLHPRHDEIIERDMPVLTEPGTEFAYNNAQYDLVARLIERATGTRYHEFLGRELLAPIGARGGEIWVNRPGGTAHAGCCIMIPPESWLRVGVLLAQDGTWNGRRLLPEGYVAAMATGTQANPHYGLGVYVAGPYVERRGWTGERTPPRLRVLHSEPYLASDLFLFDGNGNQVMYVVPSEKLVVLRTGTSPTPPAEWDNSRLPNLLIGGILRERGTSVPQRR
jgi:CubicO group peptidase (beta-lactamase class C family)